MNWTYYIVAKETNQIIGFANNFVEAYNLALEKHVNAFVVQGSILTEITVPTKNTVEVPEEVYDALEGVEEEEEENTDKENE